MAPSDSVEILLSHPHDGRPVGDRYTVTALEARRLVRAGVAVYPTKTDAVTAEGEAGVEKTARAVKAKAEPSSS